MHPWRAIFGAAAGASTAALLMTECTTFGARDAPGDAAAVADAAAVDAPPPPAGLPTWRLAATTGPSARHSSALAFDPARKGLLLVAGRGDDTLQDTWAWDGTQWAQSQAPGPGQRHGHRLATRTAAGKILLYGGRTDREQWEWDGTGWQNVTSPTHPLPMVAHGLAHDVARDVTVLFGGVLRLNDGGSAVGDDTWEWNGNDWTLRSPPTRPGARYAHAMAYDTIRKRVVVFGGHLTTDPTNETWEYDGETWTLRTPTHAPGPRVGSCMAYDPRRGVAVMFGGRSVYLGPSFSETWLWDGTDWTRGPNGPPPLRSCAIAYDDARGVVVLFGGIRGGDPRDGGVLAGETWIFE